MLRIFNHKLWHSVLVICFLAITIGSSYAAEAPRQVVEEFQNALIEVMKQGKTLGYKGRYDKLSPAIMRSHDLTKIARIVVGKEWESLTPEQQNSLTDVFTKLSIASYAHNFKDFFGESFTFDSEEETSRGGVVVHTTLNIPNDKPVKFDYMLKEKTNGWAIINIIANGVSDLALKRSEYTSILQRQGFDALITQINDKIASYAKS